jgi:hypothetical protein
MGSEGLFFSTAGVRSRLLLAPNAYIAINAYGYTDSNALMRGDWVEVWRLARSHSNPFALRQAQGERLHSVEVAFDKK